MIVLEMNELTIDSLASWDSTTKDLTSMFSLSVFMVQTPQGHSMFSQLESASVLESELHCSMPSVLQISCTTWVPAVAVIASTL